MLPRGEAHHLHGAAAVDSVQAACAQEQERQQHQIQDLIDDVAAIQKDQDFLAVETGVSVNLSGVDMWNRIVQLEKDCDHFQEVTDRLDKYVEEMLRKMFGTLDQGRLKSLALCT